MSLPDITTAWQTAILADSRCPAGLTFGFGPEALKFETSPPQIVWDPQPSTFEGAAHGGYHQALNPRPIATKRTVITAHLWGANSDGLSADSYAAAEVLEQLVVSALYNVTEGVSRATISNPIRNGNLQLGWLFQLSIEVEQPMVLPTDPTAGPPLTGVIATPDPVH